MRLLYLLSLLLITKTSLAQDAGDVLFQNGAVHTVQINFNQNGWTDSLSLYKLMNDTASENKYLKGNVIIDGNTVNDIGVRYKGNSSFNNPSNKKSFKIDLNEFISGQKYDGLKSLNLNNGFKDPTFIREKLTLDFMLQTGIIAPRCTYADLTINNIHYGLYMLLEEVDDSPFLSDKYDNTSGNLYKGDPQGSLQWFGSNASSYQTKYELKTNEDTNDWSDLVRLINIINNTPQTVYFDSLESVMNTTSYLKLRAANMLFTNLDSYDGSGHNYYIYNNNGKFDWIAWDVNESFGNFKYNLSSQQIQCLDIYYLPNPSNSRPLPTKMFQYYPTYKTQLSDIIFNWLNTTYTPSYIDQYIDSLADIIRPFVYADNLKQYTNQQFETNLSSTITTTGGPGGPGGFEILGLKSFYATRFDCIKEQLIALGYFTLSDSQHLEPESTPNVFPNPAADHIYFNLTLSQGAIISITDLTGRTMIQSSVSNNRVDVSALSAGCYILSVSDNGSVVRKQFVKL